MFFDGPHDTRSILNEVLFFLPRSRVGSVFVFDDIQTYQHQLIEQVLFSQGFKAIEVGPQQRKASYEKIQ